MKEKELNHKTVILMVLMSIIPGMMMAVNTRTINPNSFLIGNSAVCHSENTYTINPASIGLLQSSVLFQDYSLTKNQENIFFSQNLLFKLSPAFSLLLGHSLINQKIIKVENSMFRISHSINLGNFLILGANFNYMDEHYEKFHKNNLKTDLGMIISLKADSFIKFLNFGIYGLDAEVEKISLNFPNVNYGQYSALGFALGLDLSQSLDIILSADADLVRDNTVLNEKTKIYKFGSQLNFGDFSPWLSLKASGEYFKNEFKDCNAGINLDLSAFSVTYGIRYYEESCENQQYMSLSFPLRDKSDTGTNLENQLARDEYKTKIKIYCYRVGEEYKIVFKGDKSRIVFWNIKIVDRFGDVVQQLSAYDQLPDEITWDGTDPDGNNVVTGMYKIRLHALKTIIGDDNTITEFYEEEKRIFLGDV